MKKILVVDESKLFRDYLVAKLESQGFQVIQANNGLDGSIKMRNEMPDLIVLDYYLSRKSSLELLMEKKNNPNVAQVPVIMVSNKISKEQLLEISKYGIAKFFSKPLKVDSFLDFLAEVMKVSVHMDNTPCIIEAHFNDDILFVEIARGLNTEKIELLSYKIRELLELYDVKSPKILVMMSNIELGPPEALKLESLFRTFLQETNSPPRYIKILTNVPYVSKFLAGQPDFKGIEVFSSLEKAMDDILGMKADTIAHDAAAARLLTKTAPKSGREESIELRFQQEELAGGRDISVAVVDDDFVMQQMVKTALSAAGWHCTVYPDGKVFVDDIKTIPSYDLIFLDLMMPEMDGFQVLQELKKAGIEVPVIIFSALTQKETVARALGFGVKSYLIKPIKPDKLLRKASEVLRANF